MHNNIPQCRSCSLGNTTDCLYKLKINLQEGQLYEMIKTYIDETESNDIITAIQTLA